MRVSSVEDALKRLTLFELVAGILVHLVHDTDTVEEQSLYSFFADLSTRYPAVASRVDVHRSADGLASAPLAHVLTFFQMGKILVMPMPNPVSQYYEIRRAQVDLLREELESRRVVPRYDGAFAELAGQLTGEPSGALSTAR